MRELPVPARFTPGQSSLLVIILTQRTVLVCPPPGSPLASHAVESTSSTALPSRLASARRSSASSLALSPAVSPLAGRPRLDRIPIVPTV